jgi:glutaredoxin
MRTVTLYSRRDCSLCEEALALLSNLAANGPRFAIEIVDIDAEAALRARYDDAIPVIAIDGREVARAPLRASTLAVTLREAFATMAP